MINHSIKRSVSIKNHPVILGKPLSFLHGFCLLHYPVILIHSSLEQYNAKVLVMHPVIRHMTRNNSIVQICVSKLGKASHKSEKVPDWLEPTQSHEKTRFCKVPISNEYVYLICKTTTTKKHHFNNKNS